MKNLIKWFLSLFKKTSKPTPSKTPRTPRPTPSFSQCREYEIENFSNELKSISYLQCDGKLFTLQIAPSSTFMDCAIEGSFEQVSDVAPRDLGECIE